MTQKQVRKVRQAWRRICGTISVLGFVLMLGTAGSSDLDLIPLSQILIQAGIGLAMFGGGIVLGGFSER